MIILIGKSDCNKCHELGELLIKHGVKFTRINLDELDDNLIDITADILSKVSFEYGHAEELPIIAIQQDNTVRVACGRLRSEKLLIDSGIIRGKL